MSRCFPYPPPGYSEKRAGTEALIESIKLQREREKAKAEKKKEKKREKKEKKREKKEKVKHNLSDIGHDVKAHKGENNWVDLERGYNQKRIEDEAEQLEKSDLTVEHGQPVCSQNPSYSSDSTQNSNKRRRHASPTNGCLSGGNIIRIRLPLQKHKEPDLSVGKEQLYLAPRRTDLPVRELDLPFRKERLCSTGNTHLIAERKYEITPGGSQGEFCSTSLGTEIIFQGLPLRTDKEPSCSTSGMTGLSAKDDTRTTSSSMSFEYEMPRVESSLYKDLIENWVPPVLQSEQSDFDDQEWLFGRTHQERHGEKRFKACSDVLSGGSSISCPRAQYLPEVDMYALPFTVPF